ncbi:unnamed protein product [Cuscuta campestris]|uniref:Uncharacterized protein n=1 Tax=Cuscuta campestris TaxID=132261 RepID=A0A484NCB5_9ASTE|nr:unnamed protein product [Cuscuta campestris]
MVECGGDGRGEEAAVPHTEECAVCCVKRRAPTVHHQVRSKGEEEEDDTPNFFKVINRLFFNKRNCTQGELLTQFQGWKDSVNFFYPKHVFVSSSDTHEFEVRA